jgi:methionine salvage enolase-phosphatase E1
MDSSETNQTLIVDLWTCCLTENYYQEILKPYWAQSIPTFLAERWESNTFREEFSPLAQELFAHFPLLAVDQALQTGEVTLDRTQRSTTSTTQEEHDPSDDNTIQRAAPDRLAFTEKLISCIQQDLWLKGLDRLLSQLVTLGVGTGYLTPQLYPDAINSLKRWHNRRWRVISLCELNSLAQRALLQNTQAGDLTPYVHHNIPLSAHLPPLDHCALISARPDLLISGQQTGYKVLYLNRHPTQQQLPAPLNHMTQVMEMDLVDLML